MALTYPGALTARPASRDQIVCRYSPPIFQRYFSLASVLRHSRAPARRRMRSEWMESERFHGGDACLPIFSRPCGAFATTWLCFLNPSLSKMRAGNLATLSASGFLILSPPFTCSSCKSFMATVPSRAFVISRARYSAKPPTAKLESVCR